MSSLAQYAGYESVAAAVVFAILYVPLFLLFLWNSSKRPTRVYFVLTFFCVVRVTAFIIRAVLAGGSFSTNTALSLIQADTVLFGVGYFGLLFSAYDLVLNLEQVVSNNKAKENKIIRLTQNRRLFRLALLIAVALGIASSSNISSDGTIPSSSVALREASTIMFLVLTALLAFQTLYFSRIKFANRNTSISAYKQESFGAKHGIFILTVISILLLIREAFYTATMTPDQHWKQYSEKYWYPFVATTEILAVMCYLAPGLVPSAKEVKERVESQKQGFQTIQSNATV